MKKIIVGIILVCAVSTLFSCEDLFSPTNPDLTGEVTKDIEGIVTGYSMQITNLHDVESSHAAPIFYTLYSVEGEYTKIPDGNINSKPVLNCPADGGFGYTDTTKIGKYTFWVVGSEDVDKETNLTDPSNLVVLDFDE